MSLHMLRLLKQRRIGKQSNTKDGSIATLTPEYTSSGNAILNGSLG